MKTLLFPIVAALLLSCGSKKTQIKEQRDIQVKNTTRFMETSFSGFATIDSIKERLKREKVYKVTILTPPDSTGRQYPISIEEGKITEEYESSNLIKKDSTALNNKKKDDSTSSTDITKVETKQRVDRRVIPSFAWWLITGGIVAALLAWFVWKKK